MIVYFLHESLLLPAFFSHPDQIKGDSIRRQIEATRKFCDRYKLTLDESTSFQDQGVSGFKGIHRDNPDRHALAAFLKLANDGKIPPNSYLIIENLDRLTREDIRPALTLFLSILDAQINIVQLNPETIYRHDKSDSFDIMRAIIELSRGHSESAMKSYRVGEAWKNKRKLGRDVKEVLTAAVPKWLKLSADRKKIVSIPEAVRTIKLIFKLCIDGYGTAAICAKLNADHVPTIGSAPYWAASYIMKILRNRAVLGEFQPYTGRNTQRVPDGDPIANYFPAVISTDTFYAAQSALKSRRNQKDQLPRRSKTFSPVCFTTLVTNAALS